MSIALGGAAAALAALGVPRVVWAVVLGLCALAFAFTVISHDGLRHHFQFLERLPFEVGWGPKESKARQGTESHHGEGRWAIATPTVIPPPVPSSRSSGVYSGYITTGIGLKLPDGRTRQDSIGPYPPRPSTGDLPIVIDTKGLSINREGTGTAKESWVFNADDVVLVNDGDATVNCRVWLVAHVLGLLPVRELEREPNDPISLKPHKPKKISLEFRLSLALFDEDAKLNPASPKELVFVEIGGKERRRTVPFAARPPMAEQPEGEP